MAKNKYLIRDFITGRVDFKKKDAQVIKFIQEFMKFNIQALTGDGFSTRIVFGSSKNDELFDIYGLDKREWNVFANSHETLKYGENIKNPVNNLLLLHYIYSGDLRYLKFLAIKLYTSRYYKAFPKYMDEAKMKATINSLSQKFFIKKYGTLDKSLDATIRTYLNTYSDRFKRMTDDDIIYLINAIATRVDIFVKNVQRKYYNNNDRVYEDKEILDRENLRVTTNDSLVFEGVVQKTIHDEMINGFDNHTLSQAKGLPFKNEFIEMNKKDKDVLNTLIKDIMYDYLSVNPNASIRDAQNGFARFTIQGRRNGEETKSIISSMANKYLPNDSDNKKKEFYNFLLTYYTIRIHTTLIKEN